MYFWDAKKSIRLVNLGFSSTGHLGCYSKKLLLDPVSLYTLLTVTYDGIPC